MVSSGRKPMKAGIATCLLAGAAVFLPSAHPAVTGHAAASACLDVALVLAVDSSASVSGDEFALQQNGIASAFRDPAVLDAIAKAGRVAGELVRHADLLGML